MAHFDPYDLFIVKTLLWMTGWNKHNFESRRHNDDDAHDWFKLASGFKQEF